MNITEEYLAGLLDGEGYFGLMKRGGTNHGYQRKSYQPAIKMAFTDKDAEILYFLKDKYGGYINKSKAKGNKKSSTQWEIKGKIHLKNFLPSIIPYLILKKKQAELLLEFCEMGYIHPAKLDKTLEIRAKSIHYEMLILKGKTPATTE
jgi:predicted transcriptional regulator